VLETEEKYVKLGATVVNGGLGLTLDGVKEYSKGKNASLAKFVDKSLQYLSKVVGAATGPITGTYLLKNKDGKKRAKEIKKVSAQISAGIKAAISGARIAPALIMAAQEPENSKQRKNLIQKAVDTFADSVNSSFKAFAEEYGNERKGELIIIGSVISAAIKNLKKVDEIEQAIKKGDPKLIAACFGTTVIESTLGFFCRNYHRHYALPEYECKTAG